MKIAKNLYDLEVRACTSILKTIKLVPTIGYSATVFEREEKISFATINLLNTWGNFQRTYFVCCLLGAYSPSTKAIFSSQTGAVLSRQQAIGVAVTHYRPAAVPRANGEWDSRDEPTWHDSNTLLHLANVYAFSNKADIQQAFSYGFTAHKNLAVFRNYYAHKNRVTREKAQAMAVQYLIPGNLHPTVALLSAPSSSPSSTLIENWAAELTQTVQLLCS